MDRSDSPSDSEDALPVHPEILDLAIRVYRTVWEQFYRWEEAECTSAIKECERPIIIPFEIAAESVADENTQHELEFHLDPPLAMGDNQDIESFTVEVFDENQNSLRYSTLFCPDVTREEIRPYPRYEFCTPASYSYVKEAHSGNALEFLPYADDDTFEIFKYLGGFDAYSWQTDFADPDLEMIQLEVANRLIVHEHFSQSEVDRLRMLRKLRRNRSSGLLWDTAQRDPLWWWTLPGEPTIPRDFVSKSPDVFVHIDKDIQNFCPKLNCLRSFCATHNEPYGGLHEVEPKLTSAQLKAAAATEACGTSCFRQVYGNNFPMAMVKWEDPSDVVKVEGILNLLPDSSPCDLAVICRKKCSEIYAFRCNKFHDEDISSRELDNPPRHVIPVFLDDYMDENDGPNFRMLPPCHHRGPCDMVLCPCHRNKQHCQRSCRCELDCAIRWRGCNCRHTRKNGNPCESRDTCPCRRAGRECEPDVCIKCDARGKHHKKKCKNVNLQRGKFPMIIVRHGSYGLGAFASRKIPENTIIGEYVGELLQSSYVNHSSFSLIHDHTSLNYMFDLNKIEILDAAKLGNETRYLNDSKDMPDNNNCEAKVLLIDGDHRICLRTTKTVQSGQELLLSYGETYWKAGGGSRPDSPLDEGSDVQDTELALYAD